MLLFARPSKPFVLGRKGFPKRAVVLADYKDEIEDLYAKREGSKLDIAADHEETSVSVVYA
jgi:hypothetical protein